MPTTPTPPPRIALRDQPALLAEMHAIFNEYAHALLADLPEGETRGVARGVVLRVNAGLVALEETARAEYERRKLAVPSDAVLDRETAPAPREPDPESDELAEECVEVSCPRESAVPAAPAPIAPLFDEHRAKVAAIVGVEPPPRPDLPPAARAAADELVANAPRGPRGFALMAKRDPGLLREVASKGGRACAAKRAAERAA
jgi:hypothetical protein